MLSIKTYKQIDDLYIYSLKSKLSDDQETFEDKQLQNVQNIKKDLQNINIIFYIQDNKYADFLGEAICYMLWKNKNIISVNHVFIAHYILSQELINITKINLQSIHKHIYTLLIKNKNNYCGFLNSPLYDFINQRDKTTKTFIISFCQQSILSRNKIHSFENLILYNFIFDKDIITEEHENIFNIYNNKTDLHFIKQFKYNFNFQNMSQEFVIVLKQDAVIKNIFSQHKIECFNDIYIFSFQKLDYISYFINDEEIKIHNDDFMNDPEIELLYSLEQQVYFLGSKIQYIIEFRDSIIQLHQQTQVYPKNPISMLRNKIFEHIHRLEKFLQTINKDLQQNDKYHVKIIKHQLYDLYIYCLLIKLDTEYQTDICQQFEYYAYKQSQQKQLSQYTVPKNKINKKITTNIVQNHNVLKDVDQIHQVLQLQSFNDYINQLQKLEFDEGAFSQSVQYMISNISLSNWFDELKYGNCICLLLQTQTFDIVKSTYQIDQIKISKINTSFISCKDYLDTVINFFEKSSLEFGNLNNIDIIKGDGIGCGNTIIPIFISTQNWQIAKLLSKPLLGIIMGNNPYSYVEVFDNFYFILFYKIVKQFFQVKSITNPFIITLFMIYRTSIQIMSEHGFHIGITKYIQNIVNQPLSLISKQQNYKIMISQILLSASNVNDDLLKQYYQYVVEKIIVQYQQYETIQIIGKKDFINQYLVQCELIFKKYQDNLEEIKNQIHISVIQISFMQIINKLNKLIQFYIFRQLLKHVYKFNGGFKQFIKLLDSHFGIINDDIIRLVKDNVYLQERIIIKTYDDIDKIKFYPVFEWFTKEWYENKIFNYVLFGSNMALIKKTKTMHIQDMNINDFIKIFQEKFLVQKY